MIEQNVALWENNLKAINYDYLISLRNLINL